MPQSKNHIETVPPRSFLTGFFLDLMPRYVSIFGSTVSFASVTQWQWISYQLISIYCVSIKKKKKGVLNKFLNLKIVIWLIGLIFLLMQLTRMVAVEVTGRPQISFCLGCELCLV